MLFEVGIPNSLCGFILGWWSVIYFFLCHFDLDIDLYFFVNHIFYIRINFPKLCFMLDQSLCGTFATLL